MVLTKDNLILVGVLAEYYDTILELHDQLLDNDRLKFGPDTRGALKHPAWDRPSDTTPEGWMEFYKSLQHNCIFFGIVLTLFEAFMMKYSVPMWPWCNEVSLHGTCPICHPPTTTSYR
jgi:hypothetical protein